MFTVKDITIPCSLYEKHATIYAPAGTYIKAYVIYIHGGALIFGWRDDLPKGHLKAFTDAGYAVIAIDYPLAPAVLLPGIADDVFNSIKYITGGIPDEPWTKDLPCFLWGRSAGAYLALITALRGDFGLSGILSYYGYGFLADNWFCAPSPYYCSLPKEDASSLKNLSHAVTACGKLDTCFSAYVYLRQTGTMTSFFYRGRKKYFYTDYTLRLFDKLPCPLFAAHCTGDTDVPFEEFLRLSSRCNAEKFIVTGNIHDFDRDETSPFTARVLAESIDFLDHCLI